MWIGGSQNSDSYWDNFSKNLYDRFFHEADNMRQIYRDHGLPVSEYQTLNYRLDNPRHDMVIRYENDMDKRYEGLDHNNSYGGNYGSSSNYLEEPSGHASDEALARCLQEMEDGSYVEAVRTGVSQGRYSFSGEGSGALVDVNPYEMTYEQISVLGQSIGNVKKGLSEEQMSRLPTHKYKGSSKKKKGKSATDEDSECVICKMQYDKRDVLMTLPCAHKYHEKCIKTWLTEDKSCCVCKVEVAV